MRRSVQMLDLWEIRLLKGSMDRRDCCMHPSVTLLICRILGTSELVTGVSVLLAGMPAGSTTAILAEKYDGDAVYASGCIFVSTLLSLLTIPALSVLMQVI